jgi:2-oxoglutarate ferredoxin oxidoreductase subunit delta
MAITIIKDFCKGCGICIEYCPNKVYEFSQEMNQRGYRLPRIIRIEECTECGLCDLYCPDFAILLRKQKRRKKAKEKERC